MTQHNTTMKIAALFTVLIAIMLSGCIDEPPVSKVDNPVPIEPVVTESEYVTQTPVSIPTVAATPVLMPEVYMVEIGEACGTEYLTVGVKSYEVVDNYQYMGYNSVETIYPEFNYQFIIFDCAIENKGKGRTFCGALEFSMEDQNKYRYDPSNALWITDIKELDSFKELYPGQWIEGKVVFEIPINTMTATLYYDFGSILGTNLAGWNVTL